MRTTIRTPKTPETENPGIHISEVPQKDPERSGGGCARRSSVIDYHLQEESLLGSKPSSTRKENGRGHVRGHEEGHSESEGQP